MFLLVVLDIQISLPEQFLQAASLWKEESWKVPIGQLLHPVSSSRYSPATHTETKIKLKFKFYVKPICAKQSCVFFSLTIKWLPIVLCCKDYENLTEVHLQLASSYSNIDIIFFSAYNVTKCFHNQIFSTLPLVILMILMHINLVTEFAVRKP